VHSRFARRFFRVRTSKQSHPGRTYASIAIAMVSAGAVGAGVVGGSAQAAETSKSARATYIAAADKVCLAVKTDLEAAMLKFETRKAFASKSGGRAKKTTIGSPESITEYVKVAVPFLERQVQQMTLVVPPAADKALIAALLNETRTAIADAKKNPSEVAYNNPFNDVGKKFEEYGFTWCGTKNRPSDDPND
jgi:hypothetical protein